MHTLIERPLEVKPLRGPLTIDELNRLAQLEPIIERGLSDFVKVGTALLNEAQARELAKVPEAERVEVIEKAKRCSSDGKVTERPWLRGLSPGHCPDRFRTSSLRSEIWWVKAKPLDRGLLMRCLLCSNKLVVVKNKAEFQQLFATWFKKVEERPE